MFRAHELIAGLNPDSTDYASSMAAVKFDLGDIDVVNEMFVISSGEFFEIPAPICLFQIIEEGDLHFYLATKDCGGTIWRHFMKGADSCFEVVLADIEFFVDAGGETILTKRISTGEVITSGPPPENVSAWDRSETLNYIGIASSIEVFSCSNVVTVEHNPPKLINEKRIKKGKVPFFSYRTLHITGKTADNQTAGKGTHESPRLHLRRGHIRKLPGGRRIWVTQCLVGDKTKGFAAHDYKIRHNNVSR